MIGRPKLALLWIASLAISLPMAADTIKTGGNRIAITPDLRVLSVQVERSGFAADGSHLVRVRAAIVLMAPGAVCAGPFAVLVSKNDLRSDRYTVLGRGSVARLCSNPASTRAATAVLEFADTVPVGGRRRYMAQADEGNQVAEAQEGNNTATSETYVAKSYCAGVDLALTSVEIVRDGGDGVFIRASARNRCTDSCPSFVTFRFAVSAPGTGYADVTQGVNVPITGLAEFSHPAIGFYGRSDGSVTYRIRIDPDSASCIDSSPANNECLVTLAASEARKTQTCP